VLLDPDWLLVRRWEPYAAMAAGGDRPEAIDLRTGRVLVNVGLVSACEPAGMPCPRS
jgi:hypothetical protein